MQSPRDSALKIADFLLQIKAVKINPRSPYTWASGWKSPMYCDNRLTLSFPVVRNAIRASFVHRINDTYSDFDAIVGVATGGIAHGALVADELELPFAYVRSSSKGHGMQNRIEGKIGSGQKVVVIEDLVSTGKSSLNAVEALREAGCEVIGMAAIFTYGFREAIDNFEEADCALVTLTDYDHLLNSALERNLIAEADLEILKKWREAPQNWEIHEN